MKNLLRAGALALGLLWCAPGWAQHATTSIAPAGYAPETACVTWSGGAIGAGALIPCGSASGGGGSGVDPRVAQGSATAGQAGILTQGAVVTGDQSYTAGQTQPLTLTPTGRLKVGQSSATNIAPGAQPSTTIASDLAGCQYRQTPSTWSDTWTGSLRCNVNGALAVDGSGVTQPVNGTVTANLGTLNGVALDTTLSAQSAKLPASLGAKTGAASLSVVPNSDTPFPVSIGSTPDTLAATTTPLTLTSTTTASTYGPWTPQLNRPYYLYWTITGGTASASVAYTITNSCSATYIRTSANGQYQVGQFSGMAAGSYSELIDSEHDASAKVCVTVTPGSGATVSGSVR